MDDANHPPAASRIRPRLSTYQIVSLCLFGLLAAVLWSFAISATYLNAPNARRLVADFNMPIDPVSHAVLKWGGAALPAIGALGLILAWWTRSRWAWRFVLLALPLLAGSAVYFISFYCVRILLGELSGR